MSEATEARPQGEIRGKVIDKVVKTPLTSARVSIKGTEFDVACDKEGEYVISPIPDGKWTICVSMPGYISEVAENITVSAAIQERVDFSLLPNDYFDLKQWTPYYTKISVIIALIGFIIPCIFVPPTQPKPYQRKVEAVVQSIELPPQLKQLEEPPPPPKPEMPVAAETEEEVEAGTIDRTDFSGFEKAPPTLEAEMVYDFWTVEEKPELLQKFYINPEYPEIARKAGIEGSVTLELVVDTNGFVIDIKVLKSLHELLDEAAVKAAARWRFKPARQRDKAVRVRVWQPVRFKLEE